MKMYNHAHLIFSSENIQYAALLFVETKSLQMYLEKKNTILFRNYNMGPLEMYNGPSQFFIVNPEGRIQLTT